LSGKATGFLLPVLAASDSAMSICDIREEAVNTYNLEIDTLE